MDRYEVVYYRKVGKKSSIERVAYYQIDMPAREELLLFHMAEEMAEEMKKGLLVKCRLLPKGERGIWEC